MAKSFSFSGYLSLPHPQLLTKFAPPHISCRSSCPSPRSLLFPKEPSFPFRKTLFIKVQFPHFLPFSTLKMSLFTHKERETETKRTHLCLPSCPSHHSHSEFSAVNQPSDCPPKSLGSFKTATHSELLNFVSQGQILTQQEYCSPFISSF